MPHPYTTTVQGLTEVIQQLRSTFPQQVTADTLKKWSIASNNEGTVLAVLRFLKIIDEEGKKQVEASKAFVEHDNQSFAQKFADLIRASYKELFEIWGDQAWTLDKNKLISFFRNTDQSSARVGEQQFKTFQALASIAGFSPIETHQIKAPGAKPRRVIQGKISRPKPNTPSTESYNDATRIKQSSLDNDRTKNNVTLTVRIEINLPVADNQEVYDRIFRSIKENFLSE